MRILDLAIDNFKGVKHVTVTPNPADPLTIIGGLNGQGKSSTLDAAEAVLRGRDAVPGVPIREGETRGQVTMTLGDLDTELVAVKVFTEKGDRLEVRSKDGAKYPQPQAILDKLIGARSLDPLAFSRMSAESQAKVLKSLTGLDFTQLDNLRSQAFSVRTEVNREVKRLEAQLQGLGSVTPGVPTEEVSSAALAQEFTDAMANNQRHQDLLAAHIHQCDKVARQSHAVAQIEAQLAEAKAALQREQDAELAARTAATMSTEVDAASIKARLSAVEQTNIQVRRNRQITALQATLQRTRQRAEELSKQITDADAVKAAQLQAAKLPVPGLSFTDNAVFFNAVPYAQLSSAEQIRLGVAIGLACNPQLKVLFVRDGSLLDDNSMALLRQLAADSKADIWIEKVTKEPADCAVFIEAGEVKPKELCAAGRKEDVCPPIEA